MAKDEIEWDDANAKKEKMKTDNKSGMFLVTLPYKIGLTTAVGAGVASLPMVFYLDTALWFNQDYVTTDVPEPVRPSFVVVLSCCSFLFVCCCSSLTYTSHIRNNTTEGLGNVP